MCWSEPPYSALRQRMPMGLGVIRLASWRRVATPLRQRRLTPRQHECGIKGIDPTIGLPETPAIVSFSPDTGPVGADITNAKILTLTGTAPVNSTVEVFDGLTELGTTTANAAGTWSYTTGSTGNGAHSFTATDTVAVNVSAASAALTVTVDTIAPAAPQIVNDTVNANDSVTLSGTAAANSTLECVRWLNRTRHDDSKRQWSMELYDRHARQWRAQFHGNGY